MRLWLIPMVYVAASVACGVAPRIVGARVDGYATFASEAIGERSADSTGS